MTYLLVNADVGATITCTITATNASGSASASASANSNSLGPVAALPVGAPVNSVAPAISGAPTVGQTLNTSNGTWSNSPTGYTYQWRRNGVAISGATNSSYTLINIDEGATITVAVTASNAGGSATTVSAGVGPVAAAPTTEIAWTPAMIGMIEGYDATNWQATKLGGGSPVTGDRVTSIVGTANGTVATPATPATTAQNPILGAAPAETSRQPIRFTTGEANNLRSPRNFSASGTKGWGYSLMYLRNAGVAATTRYMAGVSSTSTKFWALLSSATAAGGLRANSGPTITKTITTDKFCSFGWTHTATSAGQAWVDGEEITYSTGSGDSDYLGDYPIIGNLLTPSTSAGNFDLFGFWYGEIPSANTLSRANMQRMEGYAHHRLGLQSQLPADHPYKAAPPTVPAGTTSTVGWDDVNASASSAQQTWLGSYVEGQTDSYDGNSSAAHQQPTDGTTNVWGLPYSLNSTRKAAIKADLFPNNGFGYQYFYVPLGFAYRGLRNIDGTSGLARNIGERFSGQNASIADMLGNGVKVAFQYHSPAPHWKQSGVFGNYTDRRGPWAGGSYARTVSLESIKTSDPTQYAAQIDAFTSAVIDDMEYVHQNIGPIGMFGLQNEPFNTDVAGYGHCEYGADYKDVMIALYPKIQASSILPKDILIHVNSWTAFTQGAPSGFTGVSIWAGSLHRIVDISGDADYIRSNANTWSSAAVAEGKPLWDNEFEYFSTGSTTAEWRCANNMLVWAHMFELLNAPAHCHILHFAKQIGASSASSNTEGYAMYRANLPAPFGYEANDATNNPTGIAKGEAEPIPTNYNSAKLILDNLKVGSKHVPRYQTSTLPAGCQQTAVVTPEGKLQVYLINRTGSPVTFTYGVGRQKTMSGKRYRVDALGAAVGQQSASVLAVTVPAYSGEVWSEAA